MKSAAAVRKGLGTTILVLLGLFIFAAGPVWAGAAGEILAGNEAAETGNLDRALEHFNNAINSKDISPKNLAWAYHSRAAVMADKDMFEQAIADYNKAIEINPQYDASYFNRSFVHEHLGQPEKALADAQKAVELDPSDQDFQDRLADLKRRMGR